MMHETPIARGLDALASRVRSFRTWALAKRQAVQSEPNLEDIPVEALVETRLGHVLCGKYRLESVLGVGGMAAVYVATHRNRRRFAIKMLHPQLSCNAQVRTRFKREGWLANSVEHDGVVAVLDDDVAEDGSVFLVMELLEGDSVENLWERHGAFPVPIALALGDQLLDVLRAAHAHRIVHRDLKPGNLFLTRSGALKVLDFGIARVGDAAGSMTQAGAVLGSPGFMAPEQVLGSPNELSAQADLWAVGATLFSLISGQQVHEGETPQRLLTQAATQPARPLSSVAPKVPRPLALAIDRALAFDRRDRYADAASMRAALRQAYLETSGAALDASNQVLATWLEQQRHLPARARGGETKRVDTHRRWRWLAILLLVLAVLALIALSSERVRGALSLTANSFVLPETPAR